MEIREPKPEITLLGQDGNVFVIIGRCMKVLEKSGLYNDEELKEIRAEFMSGDYDKALQTAMKYCDVD